MVIWIDDVRKPPFNNKTYIHLHSVNEAKNFILHFENKAARGLVENEIEYIDIDHDAGDYAPYGGDYIKLLDWLEERGACYNIRIHSMNPVGRENMRRIIQHNGWKEIF